MQTLLITFRRLFLGGLLVVVPAILTFLVLRFLFEIIDGITRPLFEKFFDTYVPGTGLLATLVVILLAGVVTRFFIGRKFYHFLEELIQRIPLVGFVYGPARQLMESFTTGQAGFSDVVLIEYPSKNIFTIAFATRRVAINTANGSVESIVIFVPTTPTPLSGFTVLVPVTQVRKVNLTIEQAMRYVVSGGISSPDVLETEPMDFKSPQPEARLS